MYAIARINSFDETRLAAADESLSAFDKLHAAQPGFLGSVVVDSMNGRRLVVNLWQSEKQATAGLSVLRPEVERVLTSAEIEPDPRRRIALVAAWTELPELVTANQGEDGILDLCDLLLARGIGIEAGLLSLDDAHAFVSAGIAARCVRAMVEPLDADPDDATAHAAAIDDVLTHGDTGLEQIHHGDGIASWAVNRRAVPRGHGIRTGLEDTPVLPDGRQAPDNAELVAAAAAILRGEF